jgi:hypothetical protein
MGGGILILLQKVFEKLSLKIMDGKFIHPEFTLSQNICW